MAERIVGITVTWGDRKEDSSPRDLIGLTFHTRNDDDSDPPTTMIPVAELDKILIDTLTATAPAAIAARAAKMASLESPETRAARLKEEADAARAQVEAQINAAQIDLAQKQADLAALDAQIAQKKAQLDQ